MNAVTVENITKIYKLYDKPVHRLKELAFHKPYHKEFIALDNLSFKITKGGTFGILGDNGAGKTTLLKILSRTLSPTSGHFETRGIVSSLLELGSGFHPEFTGIENIFFYGSLLGIDNGIMKNRVNEIIDFAELGDFIHYPIKTYSSGMHVRLAFSVATAVDPDILIIDEAISVGDQYFQKKCLEKMDDFKRRGKTILFCSHDIYQLNTFCEQTLWLDHGQIRMLGESSNVINSYVSFEQEKSEAYKSELIKVCSSTFLFISNLKVKQEKTNDISAEFTVTSHEPFYGHIGWAILRRDMLKISFTTTHEQGMDPILFHGTKKISIMIENLNLVSDNYFFYVGIFDKEAYKPIVIESMDCAIRTDYEVFNALCYFKSAFSIE